MRLGKEVRRARRAAGMRSQAALAAAAGISVRSVAKLEQPVGEPAVGSTVLEAVARVLPEWTEETPRLLLDDTPIPEPEAEPEEEPWSEDDEKIYDALVRLIGEHRLRRRLDYIAEEADRRAARKSPRNSSNTPSET